MPFTTPFTVRAHNVTGELWLVTETGAGIVTWLLPLKQNAVIADIAGNQANVINGAVQVGRFDGLPQMLSDATGAAAYADLGVAARRCSNAWIRCNANGAIVSFNGGTTDHIPMPATTSHHFPDLDIPAGATISAKNLVALSNYTDLYVCIW